MRYLSDQRVRLFGWLTLLYGFFVPTIKPVEAVLSVLMITLAFSMIVTGRHLEKSLLVYGLLLLCYLGADSVSLLINSSSSEAFRFFVKNVTIFLGLTVALIIRDTRPLLLAVATFCLGTGLLAAWTVLEGVMLGSLRPPGLMNQVHTGYVLSFGTLVTFLLVTHLQLSRHMKLLSLLLPVAGLLVNATRGAWVATVVALLPTVLRSGKKRFFFLSVTTLLVLLLSVPSVRTRTVNDLRAIMDSSYRGKVETSMGAKIEMWLISLEMFKSSPLFGIGNINWQRRLPDFTDSDHLSVIVGRFNQSHNMFIHTLATSGLTGFSALLLLLAYPLCLARKYAVGSSLFSDLMKAVSMAFIAQGLFDSATLLYRPFHCYLFLVSLSLSGIILQKKELQAVSG